VVALVPQALVGPARAAVEQAYRGPQGEQASIYVCRAAAGAGAVDVAEAAAA
jgi:galactokinase